MLANFSQSFFTLNNDKKGVNSSFGLELGISFVQIMLDRKNYVEAALYINKIQDIYKLR